MALPSQNPPSSQNKPSQTAPDRRKTVARYLSIIFEILLSVAILSGLSYVFTGRLYLVESWQRYVALIGILLAIGTATLLLYREFRDDEPK